MKLVHRCPAGWLTLSLGLAAAVCSPAETTPPATPFLELQQGYSLKGMGVGLDVATCPAGAVYVSSASRPGLWRLEGESGRFVAITPSRADKAAVRLFPDAIECDAQNQLWLADATGHQVYVLTPAGEIAQRYGPPALLLEAPAALNGRQGEGMAVWDKRTGTLWTYSMPEGRFTGQALSAGPQCVASSAVVAYCVGENGRVVAKYQRGKLTNRYGLEDDAYAGIGEIVLGPDQEIYLTDAAGKRLLSLTADLQLSRRFSLTDRPFIRPTRFAFRGDELWLLDEGREELLRFTRRQAVTGLEHELLGEEYLALSQYEPALEELNIALQLGYRNPEVYLRQGQALYGLKRYSEALTAFSQTQGTGAAPYFWQGNALFRLGRYEDALAAFQAALDREPANDLAQFNMAQTLLALNRLAPAEAAFRSLLQQAPDNRPARLGLGRCLLSSANPSGAISVLAGLAADQHAGREARHYLGLAYLQTGALAQALPLLERAAQEGPYFRDALNALAGAYRQSGDPERAQYYEQKMKNLKPQAEPLAAFLEEETL